MVIGVRKYLASGVVGLAALACSEPPPAPRSDSVSLLWRNEQVSGESIPVYDGTAIYNLEQETHVVSAVRKNDGITLWKKTLPVSQPGFDGHGLALAAGVLVVGDMDLFGLDPGTGDILWQFVPSEGRNPGYSALTAVGSTIYAASTTGHLYAVNAATGTQRWAMQFNTQLQTPVYHPRVVDGVIYASFTYRPSTGPHQGGAVAVDTAGNLIWKVFTPRPTPSTHTEANYPVAVTATEVVVGDNIGAYFLDRTTGALLKTLGPADFGDVENYLHLPLIARDLVIIGTGSAKVFAFDVATRTKAWQRSVGASVTSMAIDGDYLYVAVLGPFRILRSADGTVAWSLANGVGPDQEGYLTAPAIEGKTFYLPGTRSVRAFKME